MNDRRLTLVLAISLFVNVFAAGAIGGGLLMLSRQAGVHPHAAMPRRPVIDAGEALPPPDRARFTRLMRQMEHDSPDLIRVGRENREAAANLFVEPQFDADAVNAALQRARDADLKLRIHLETEVIAFAATLPVEERAILEASLARGGPLRHPARGPIPR